MPNIFDLSKISRLVESQHLVRILVMDTNILMNEPDPHNWSVAGAGPNLFVLSQTLNLELELVHQKRGSKEREESSEKANIAIKSMASLNRQGTITDGIPVKNGWVIGVPSPRKSDLCPELEQLPDFVEAFKTGDTTLLLLTRECHQLFISIPVTLITGDGGFSNAVQTQGVPCHLCTRFPIEGLKENAAIIKPVDWEQVLGEIESDTKQKAIAVEASLTGYKSAPQWLGTKALIIAEGMGTMHDGKKKRPFIWTIPFYPQNIIGGPISSDENTPDITSIHLDFLGKDDFAQNIFDGIADRLSDCANINFEEGKPTLQSPQSVMEMLLYMEYILRNGVSEEALETLRQEIEESEGLIHYWTDWILGLEDEDERTACLEGFIEAVKSCWKIGRTYKFSFIPYK